MKSNSLVQKRDSAAAHSSRADRRSGRHGIATTPPAYGIDLVDSGTRVGSARNHTGLPDGLKSGIETLSGMAMDEVRVHYNSARPAQLQALAYTQGRDIHVAPGQERHLPHEAWHVVQQKQGRVEPTWMGKGAAINDNPALEHEADVMGAKALQMRPAPGPAGRTTTAGPRGNAPVQATGVNVIQGAWIKNIKVHNESVGFGTMFAEKTYGGEPGLVVHEDETGAPDKFDLDTSVYPHINPTALANYDSQARAGKRYIDQTEVMEVALHPAEVFEYPESSTSQRSSPAIRAIVYHAGGMSMTVYPRQGGQVAGKLGRAVRGVLMSEPYKFVQHIAQADPRHASTHIPPYTSALTGQTWHDHFFKWPPSVISSLERGAIEAKFVQRGLIRDPQKSKGKVEHEDAVMEEYVKEAKQWEAHENAWANAKWSF